MQGSTLSVAIEQSMMATPIRVSTNYAEAYALCTSLTVAHVFAPCDEVLELMVQLKTVIDDPYFD